MFPLPARSAALLYLICLASSVQAQKPASPIHDDAGMFHAATIDHAEQEIAAIQRTFDCGVFVRTIASASPRPSRWLPTLRTPRVNRMLEEQVRSFAAESALPGLYIVVCSRPRAVHVVIQPEGNADLSSRDAEMLRQNLLRDLHDKGNDAALLSLVERVQGMLLQNASRSSTPAVEGVVLIGLLCGGLALWLFLRLVRRRIRAGSLSDREPSPRERLAMHGDMLGFPAGQWIFDKMYPCSEKSQVIDAS